MHYYLGFKPRFIGGYTSLQEYYAETLMPENILLITTRQYCLKLPEEFQQTANLFYTSPETFYPAKKRLYLFSCYK